MKAFTKTLMDTKYVAEWIAAQHQNEYGEWNPDEDEYVGKVCETLEEAQRVALEESKRCNVAEWCRVAVERFNPELDIPRRSPAAWDTVATWHSDWSGEWVEDR